MFSYEGKLMSCVSSQDSSAEMIVAVDVSPVSLPNSMGTFAAYIDAMERVTRDVDPASGLAYARRSADQMLQPVIAVSLDWKRNHFLYLTL